MADSVEVAANIGGRHGKESGGIDELTKTDGIDCRDDGRRSRERGWSWAKYVRDWKTNATLGELRNNGRWRAGDVSRARMLSDTSYCAESLRHQQAGLTRGRGGSLQTDGVMDLSMILLFPEESWAEGILKDAVKLIGWFIL